MIFIFLPFAEKTSRRILLCAFTCQKRLPLLFVVQQTAIIFRYFCRISNMLDRCRSLTSRRRNRFCNPLSGLPLELLVWSKTLYLASLGAANKDSTSE